ncbi:midasin [Terfezia boudieri ATCC MYA-4762]|uniref:Midasin n=1 Tax=Terfezia boudieri ATCC MYA-4762 TaxID=1051890 RepID=A0A3N4LKM9_9PEZI|nr:midasin [Terfezia boudieri ATCC MYA-4762]
MDCTSGDARLVSSPLFAQLSLEVQGIITGKVHIDAQKYLSTLSALAVEPSLVSLILTCYEPLFPELVSRWSSFASLDSIAGAFSRILPLEPHLIVFAQETLRPHSKPSLLEQISHLSNDSTLDELESLPLEKTREILLALYRLLMFRRETFISLVEPLHLFPLLVHPNRAIRYLVIKIISIYMNVGDFQEQEMVSNYLGEDAVLGIYEGRTVDYGFLVLLENKRLLELQKEMEDARSSDSDTSTPTSRIIQENQFSASVANLCGVLTPRPRGPSPESSKVILTPSARVNVHNIALALRSPQPLLITGPAGCGKSFLIHEIAQNLNELSSMVSIHLGEQTDAKLLIGTYTSGTTPGSFEWRPGVLTTAVREGRWVLVEDIDKAPTEVLSVLLPLMERGELHIASRGEKISAGNGFRLITTMRIFETTTKAPVATTNILGSRLWNRVDIQPPTEEELRTIVDSRFPLLRIVSSLLLDVYNAIHALYREPTFFSVSKTSLGRQISPRDLFKWCQRLNTLFTSIGVKEDTETISQSLFDETFMEAVDCFAANLHTREAKTVVVNRIAERMQVPSGRVELYLHGHMPTFHSNGKSLVVGRAKLEKQKGTGQRSKSGRPFAKTGHALRLLEQIGVAVRSMEPVLLVGETGTGKTTAVQQLADILGYKLTVINLSQQTESGDLLGGYKPVDVRTLAVPLKDSFEGLFERTFSVKRNAHFIEMLNKCFSKQQWARVITLWKEALKKVEDFFNTPVPQEEQPKKKKRKLDTMDRPALQAQWTQFAHDLGLMETQATQLTKSLAFSFIEGSLVRAARTGDWILLDEINLAAPDTLESIADLLKEGGQGSILLSEKGAVDKIVAHPNFRIFGCMNPATDVGKRDLLPGLRSRFTELYVSSPDGDLGNLISVVNEYIGHLCLSDEKAPADISRLYLEIKQLAESHSLVDGAGQRPHFSLRTLTRTLSYVNDIAHVYGLRRSIYEGFCMSFLTLLDRSSEELLIPMLEKHLLGSVRNVRSLINQIPKRPDVNGDSYVQFKHYWMHRGGNELQEQPHYIITPFVEKNMLNLVRATATKRFPVLIQGPTSSGKTSMIEYLAKRTGHRFMRINNHEHTDLQEYLGTYVSDSDGKLKFQEGILVEALRKGHWIVLDELNLAPTDVLEALNRLLDDNRELLIPETQEAVRPHKDFMLFATQNPPGLYGGRKVLSRAFRNRFLELHFGDIPEDELETILKERCQIAPSYCTKIVTVYKELSVLRQTTRLFEQKNSFATLRDLFRWANRAAVGYQKLAENGFMLLAERVRKAEDKLAVKKVIEKVMKVNIDDESLYRPEVIPEFGMYKGMQSMDGIVWTKAMRRLFALVAEALRNNEPVLLVGETGCGKTTVCQMLAQAFGKELFIVNAHQNTETGDIIGAQRPIRNRTAYSAQLHKDLMQLFTEHIPSFIGRQEISLEDLVSEFSSLNQDLLRCVPEPLLSRILQNRARIKALFEWADGSLVQAMKNAQFFLLDEISLADDSVLERLNSVLESHRTLVLAEKGPDGAKVVAEDGFQFFATMNPGGDYGKKELSPALRNRFTEIWVPAMSDLEDITKIVSGKLNPPVKKHVSTIVNFAHWFSEIYRPSPESSVSIRDVLSWVKFVNLYDKMDASFGILNGAALVFFDSLGANPSGGLTNASNDLSAERARCIKRLSELTGKNFDAQANAMLTASADSTHLQLGDFSLPKTSRHETSISFNLQAPTTAMNAMKVVRAMQLRKPILLEGSPGVGKTSLVSALSSATGNPLIRINLSEQTDLMDLFGSDVPVDGGQSGEFMWRDAPFLQAMQRGHWVLLDEMNLASQSVLEGLNACLDHRGEAYIAELDRTFSSHPDFVVFAAQNPHHQGGGRKGLPASFVNRFTVVYIDSFNMVDLQMIATRLYPTVPDTEIGKLIKFIVKLDRDVNHKRSFGHVGGPWEFNLRDTMRWLGLLSSKSGLTTERQAGEFVDVVVKQRFRTQQDRAHVDQLYEEVFGTPPNSRCLFHRITKEWFQVGHALLPRNKTVQLNSSERPALLIQQLPVVETVMTCVEQNWPCILVGPSGSGKSSIIRLLANIAGHKLDEMALNTDVDTIDIVGGFEQVDVSRKVSIFLQDVEEHTKQRMFLQLLHGNNPVPEGIQLLEFFKTQHLDLKYLRQLEMNLQAVIHSDESFEEFLRHLQNLMNEYDQPPTARFEWVDGMLVRAVQEGRWLILDNANLCSASVLDRLNSLLEIGGSLIINEHSDENGEPKLIHPHPNFRLFITMDPKHGELSRAMRNRGIEVYVEAQTTTEPVAAAEDEKRIAVAKYAASTAADSALSTFHMFDPLQDPQDLVRFLEISINYVPLEHQNHILRWRSMLAENAVEKTQHLGVLDVYLDLFSHTQLRKLASDLLAWSLEKMNMGEAVSFSSAQSLHPLVNSFLLRSPQSYPSQLNPYNLAAFYDIVYNISRMAQAANNIVQRSNITKMGELTVLERSALQRQNTHMIGNTGMQLFAFLSATINAIHNWSVDSSVVLDEVTLNSINDLTNLWWDVVQLSDTPTFDESVFYVYLVLYREWINKNQSVLPPQLLEMIKSSLKVFKAQLQLTSGFSMEVLWEQFRPSVPSTVEGWSSYTKLHALAARFDAIVPQFDGSLEEMMTIRRSLAQALAVSLLSNSSSDTLIVELDSHITDVERRKETGQTKTEASFFGAQFNHLLKSRDLLASISPQFRVLDDNVAINAHFAGRPTTSLLWYQEGSHQLKFAFPPILRDMWLYPKSVETNGRPRQFFSGCYGFDLLNTHQSVVQGTIEQLPALQSEIGALGRQLVTQTKDVSQDHILSLKVLLLSNIEGVVDAHKSLYSSEQFVTVKENLLHIKSAIQRKSTVPTFSGIKEPLAWTGNEQFNAVLGVDLLRAVELVTKSVASVREAVQNTGAAWIHYAQGCLKLYVPNCPLDPAMKSIVKRERFLRRKSDLKDKIEANREFELQFTGQDSSPIIEQLKQKLESLGEEPPDSLIARPVESQMAHLQGDFAILLRTISGKSQDKVLTSILHLTEGYKEEEELLQKSLEQMIERLQSNYPLYKDIVDPLIGFLYSLKLGFSMAAMEVGTHNASSELSKSLLTPTDILTWTSRNSEINISLPHDQLFHGLWSLATQTRVEGPQRLDKTAVTAISNIFHTFYRNWKITSIKEQEEARANASTYRYRGAGEGDDEAEIKEMFPDYSDEEENSEEADAQEKSRNQNHSEFAVELAKCHTAMLLPEEQFELSLKQLVLRGVSLCVKLLKGGTTNSYLSPSEFETLLPAQIHTLKDSERWLFGHKPAVNKYNFYRDENLEQAQKLVAIMDKLHHRVLQLAETWPENVTLQDALEACQQVMNLPNTTPVAKFLIHIERLHHVLHEWQGVASKQYTLAEHLDALTQLTISWRRLELQAWPSLFDAEDERCQFEAGSWWFFLYESVIANPSQLVESGESLDAHIGDLTTALSTFVQNSTVGQFKARLRLLRVFQEHVSQFLDRQHRLSSAIENLVCYYTEYTSIFSERILEARRKAEKEINEVILLASWKDTNIIALRESARRSHYKLYKIVRRYRASLGEPVLPVLHMLQEALKGTESTISTMMDVIISPHFDFAQTICAAAVDTWNDRPKRLLDIAGTVKFIQRISTLHPNFPDASDIIDTFTSNVASSIKEFQSLTPSILTDYNKDEVKHLKSRKRVAYTDALKALRLMGLKSNLSSALLAKQESLEKIFAVALALGKEKVVDTTAATKYFNRTLEALPRVRRTAQDHSADLSSIEILRSIGFIEHLTHLAIQQRDEISRSSLEFAVLKSMLEVYNEVGSCFVESKEAKLYGSETTNEVTYNAFRRVFKWLPGIFDYVLDVLKAHVEFRGVQMADEVRQFTEWRGIAWDVDKQFSASKPLYKGLWDNSTKRLMEIAVSTIDRFTQGLRAVEAEYPDIKYLTTQVLPWLATVASVENTSDAVSNEATTLKDLDKSLQELCDSIFVAFQRLNVSNATYPVTEDEQGWFLKYQTTAISSIKALHISDITRRMQGCMSLLASLPFTEKTSQVARAMFAAYSPIIEQYKITCHEVISRLASLHQGTCKMTYILGNAAATIGSKGFCTPQEKSEEKGDSGKVESGIGLGEGEGIEDISKDVGADEDLSEVAQEKNKEAGGKDIENEEGAVDIDDEMEGQLRDMQEKENEDDHNEGEEKEDEENEMDEETGEVDELDPTAVDEKLWDEKGGKDSREQEGDTKGNKPQDDMEAKKEHGREWKEQEEWKEGNGGEEGEEEEEAPADEHDEVKKGDMGTADQHIPEVDTLDLPEDMNLDQDEEKRDEDQEGLDIDDLSDVEDAKKNVEEDEGDKKSPEEFPEAQMEEKGNENKQADEIPIGEEKEGKKEEEGEQIYEGAQGEEDEPTEDNLLQNKSEEARPAEETAPSEVQGIEGGSEKQQGNEATSTHQDNGEQREEQGNQGQGKSEHQSDGQAVGRQAAQPDQSRQKDQKQHEQQSVEKSSFRKVGDILEKWHRQQKEILDAEKEKERKHANEMDLDNAEFEHLPDEDAAADTQAMGSATQDQAHSVDDSMAIDVPDKLPQNFEEDETMEDSNQPSLEDKDNNAVKLGDENALERSGNDIKTGYAGAMIGFRDTSHQQPLDTDRMALDDVGFEDLTPEALHALQSSALRPTSGTRSHNEARALWQKYENSTRTLSQGLTEQLRLILEPTLATKMRGDFRTGKRLNMKRIIPYIASQYKKDKIWMRRTKPSKRQYQVMIALDDSKSMAEAEGCVELAFETVTLVAKAMGMLEVGQIGIVRFGEETEVVHPFDKPFTAESGVRVMESFNFKQQKTNVRALLETSLALFNSARLSAPSTSGGEMWQLELIVSDGVCEGHNLLQRLVRKAMEQKVMVVFVVVDALREGSILDMKKVRFEGDRPVMERYLDTFPFTYYLVVQDVRELPGVLAGALRQWLQEVVETGA